MKEKADFKTKRGSAYHRHLKRAKLRFERRKAKREPQSVPTYGRYRGWES